MFDKFSKIISKKEEEEVMDNVRTNDILANKFPDLVNKIWANKKGRFVQVEDIIITCVDKKHIEKSIKNLVISLKIKQEEIIKKYDDLDGIFDNFLNDIETTLPSKKDE